MNRLGRQSSHCSRVFRWRAIRAEFRSEGRSSELNVSPQDWPFLLWHHRVFLTRYGQQIVGEVAQREEAASCHRKAPTCAGGRMSRTVDLCGVNAKSKYLRANLFSGPGSRLRHRAGSAVPWSQGAGAMPAPAPDPRSGSGPWCPPPESKNGSHRALSPPTRAPT